MKQIQFMGNIYSSTGIVYAWIGEGDAATDRALDYLNSAGYREYFFSNNDESIGPELLKPSIWAAAWCGFTALLTSTDPLFPLFNHSKTSWFIFDVVGQIINFYFDRINKSVIFREASKKENGSEVALFLR